MIADVGHQRGVGAPAALEERREANADERRQIAASDLRCPVDRVILGRQPRERRAPPQRLEPLLGIRARLDCKRARVRLFRRLNIVAAVENLADLRERSRVGGIERDGPAEVPERLVQLPLLTLDRAKFAIEKRAVRRVADGAGVELNRLVGAAGTRGLTRPRDDLLRAAEPHHLDAARDLGQRRIGGDGRLERGHGLVLPVEGEQCLPAADQRRDISRVSLQRAIEPRQRRSGILARKLEIAERRFRRIKGGRRLQRGRKLPLRIIQIARLQESPAAIFAGGCRSAGKRRRYRRTNEFRKLRRRRHRYGDDRFLRARAGSDRDCCAQERHENTKAPFDKLRASACGERSRTMLSWFRA